MCKTRRAALSKYFVFVLPVFSSNSLWTITKSSPKMVALHWKIKWWIRSTLFSKLESWNEKTTAAACSTKTSKNCSMFLFTATCKNWDTHFVLLSTLRKQIHHSVPRRPKFRQYCFRKCQLGKFYFQTILSLHWHFFYFSEAQT